MSKVKVLCVIVLKISVALVIEGLQDYTGTEVQKCINCLCHARTGCWNRYNCAKYSLDFDYWKQAGSPTLSPEDDPDSEDSYERCMLTENCIIATIAQYTDSFGEPDCNCDGKFDCKDRLAIHLFGEHCANPVYGKAYARRFNHCASKIGVDAMLSSEGNDNCEVDSH